MVNPGFCQIFNFQMVSGFFKSLKANLTIYPNSCKSDVNILILILLLWMLMPPKTSCWRLGSQRWGGRWENQEEHLPDWMDPLEDSEFNQLLGGTGNLGRQGPRWRKQEEDNPLKGVLVHSLICSLLPVPYPPQVPLLRHLFLITGP